MPSCFISPSATSNLNTRHRLQQPLKCHWIGVGVCRQDGWEENGRDSTQKKRCRHNPATQRESIASLCWMVAFWRWEITIFFL